MATPSLAMIPSAYADSKVYSVLPNNGDGDFTFNRDSSATRVGQNGLIQTVGYFSSQLVNNGSFDDTSAWTISGGNAAISNGKLNFNNAANYGTSVSNSASVVSGKTYLVEFTISDYSSGAAQIRLGSQFGTSRNANGTYTEYIVANATEIRLYSSSSNTTLSIDNVSVKEVLGDQPRLNYDISNGVVQSCPSLMLEPASTNVINYSEPTSSESSASGITYESYIWAVGHFTNCVKFGDNSVTRYRYFTATIANSTQYVMSAFVIMDDLSEPVLGTNTVSGDFILRVGGTSATTGNFPNVNMGNNIYRVSSLITSGASGGTTGLLKYQGQSNKGFRIVGFQVEELSYATSYIPTNGSSQTRAVETCTDAGTAATFNSTEGVFYAEIKTLEPQPTGQYISINDGSGGANQVRIGWLNSKIYVQIRVNGNAFFTFNPSSPTHTNFNKIAVKFKESDYAIYINGQEVATDTSSNIFASDVLDTLSFSAYTSTGKFFGRCKDLRVYNEALTDAQLQTLTTL